MEINKSSDITGVITTEDIVEGRMVLLTSHPTYPADLTGRLVDVPGVKLPDTLLEAARATYCLTWKVENRTPPMTVPWIGPFIPWSLRVGGFDRPTNLPLTNQTIYMTYPGYQISMTIPSGMLALGYNCCGGEFTIPSGQYVYDVTMQVPGTRLRVCNTATDGAASAGMLAIMISGTVAVAEVSRFNEPNFEMTFRHAATYGVTL